MTLNEPQYSNCKYNESNKFELFFPGGTEVKINVFV